MDLRPNIQTTERFIHDLGGLVEPNDRKNKVIYLLSMKK